MRTLAHPAVHAHTPSRARLPCRYEVQKKRKTVLDDMCELITQRFVDRNTNRVQCGIIYCFSRSDCEKVARELQSAFNKKSGPRVSIK